MKKIMIAAAIVCAAAFANAATVGWSCASIGSAYNGSKYYLYIVASDSYDDTLASVKTSLGNGEAVTGSFADGAVAYGMINVTASVSQKTIDTGTYKAFFVLFDDATPAKGESKYIILGDGANGMAKTISASTATTTLAAGNVATAVSTASNWKSYGSVPEPTSAMLMLLGVAGLALRRKQK